jgi:hypothetical protein
LVPLKSMFQEIRLYNNFLPALSIPSSRYLWIARLPSSAIPQGCPWAIQSHVSHLVSFELFS